MLLGRDADRVQGEKERRTDRQTEGRRSTEAAAGLRPRDTRLRLPLQARVRGVCETHRECERMEGGGDGGGGEDSRRIPMAKWLSYLNGRAAASRQSATL